MKIDLVVQSVHQVPVAVHGHGDRAVPESGLDCLWMLTVRDEPCGMRVTQILDPARRAHGFGDGSAPCPPKGPSAEHLSPFGSPHHVVDRWACLEVLGQRVHNDAWYPKHGILCR